MCGIAGIFDPRNRFVDNEHSRYLMAMLRTLEHRGPDSEGIAIESSGMCALGHKRLAINDLTPSGHQPMTSQDGRWTIVYNGELYNQSELKLDIADHAFVGTSDTEVLLESIARFGVTKTLSQADAMFGFGIWDHDEQVLWLARDRFGEKPIYYAWIEGTFFFASELKALSRLPNFSVQLDDESLATYLDRGYIPAPFTIFQGARKIEAGTVLRVDRDTQKVIRYWDPLHAARTAKQVINKDNFDLKTFEESLSAVVKSRLQSDVPVGALLSGGVDSSLVVAMMSRHVTGSVRTFSIGFANSSYDETPFSDIVAKTYATTHTSVKLEERELLDVVPVLGKIYCEPFADSSQIATVLLSQITRRSVKVALSGDGGDEIFRGYERYRVLNQLEVTADWVPSPIRNGFGSLLQCISVDQWNRIGRSKIGVVLPKGLRVRSGARVYKFAEAMRGHDREDRYRRLNNVSGHLPRLLVSQASSRRFGPSAEDCVQFGGVEYGAISDLYGYLPDDLLTKIDRASMAASLEVRSPLLSKALFDFSWSTDSEVLTLDGLPKWPLREILKQDLARDVVDRPKQGFAVPIGTWLRGPLAGWAHDMLSSESVRQQGVFDSVGVNNLLKQHMSGDRDYSDAIWTLLMLQAWLDER